MTPKMNIPYFDAHCDTISRALERGESLFRNSGHLDIERLGAYTPSAQVFAIFSEGGDYSDFEKQYEFFVSELGKCSDAVSFRRDSDGAEETFAAGKTAAFLSVEGAELLNCDEALLEKAYGLGVRIVTLTWNHENALSGSCAEGSDKGLTAKGRSFIKKCAELGVLVDVSHLSERGFWDVMENTDCRVIATHSCLKSVYPHSRGLTDGQFAALAERGGVMGINYYSEFLGPGRGIDAIVENIDRCMATAGSDAIALGSDFDGCSPLANGISGVQSVADICRYLFLTDHEESDIEKIMFTNMMRVLSV